jgi:aerobic carbon-monoxide dehydrogenase large subunit
VAYTGQSLKRFEDPRLLTGQGAFLDDLTFPDMLYAAVLRSPHAHASIRAIDMAAARHAPGVVAVITAEDLEGVVEPLPTRRETEAQELRPPVHPLLARGKVCYTGQPVAVVVAQERYLVRDALALIRVDYAPLPAVIDPLEALQAAAVHTRSWAPTSACASAQPAVTWTRPLRRPRTWSGSATACSAWRPPRWRPAVSWPTTSPRTMC